MLNLAACFILGVNSLHRLSLPIAHNRPSLISLSYSTLPEPHYGCLSLGGLAWLAAPTIHTTLLSRYSAPPSFEEVKLAERKRPLSHTRGGQQGLLQYSVHCTIHLSAHSHINVNILQHSTTLNMLKSLLGGQICNTL